MFAVSSMNGNMSFCDHPQVGTRDEMEFASSVGALLSSNKMMLYKLQSTQPREAGA